MKLLLHTCCGPCFLGVWEILANKKHKVKNYFFNPNIWPEGEYKKRLKNLKKVITKTQTDLIEEPSDPTVFTESLKTNKFPGRCLDCYRLRLAKTAHTAQKMGFDAFSTTLLVSPYQNHEALKRIGEELSREFNIKFYYEDFRPYFRAGQEKAQKADLYRQKYCGCESSFFESKVSKSV